MVRESAKNSLVRMTEPGDENWKWVDVGHTRPKFGAEMQNPALAAALKDKREFTHAEFESFNAVKVSHDSYIAVQEGAGATHKIKFFKPNDVVSRASAMFENCLQAIRDCALEVVLEVAVVARAVDVIGKLLSHERTDLRLWAVGALGDLAVKQQQNVCDKEQTRRSQKLISAQPWPLKAEEEQADQDAGQARLSPVSELIREGKVRKCSVASQAFFMHTLCVLAKH